MIYQIHPDHGKWMPVSIQDAQANEKNGWKTVSKEEFYGKTEKPKKLEESKEPELNISRESLIELYVLRFGKKPHGMMKDSTMKAALEAE